MIKLQIQLEKSKVEIKNEIFSCEYCLKTFALNNFDRHLSVCKAYKDKKIENKIKNQNSLTKKPNQN